jgi:hypothetical protein
MSIHTALTDYSGAQKSRALYNSSVPYDRRYSLEAVIPPAKLESQEKVKITHKVNVNKNMTDGARSREGSPCPDNGS